MTTLQVCGRCGHRTIMCPWCERHDRLLGARIGIEHYCHLLDRAEASCYMLESWERAGVPTGRIAR